MPTAQPNVNAYLRTKILTASPEELRLMLLDGAIKFARQAAAGLQTKDHEQTFNGFDRARAIVLELINSVRPEVDPELCGRVSSLYTFIYGELVAANLEKDADRLAKVTELLEFERETWAMLMHRLSEERAAAAHARTCLVSSDTAPAVAEASPASDRLPLSLQG